QTLYPFIKVQKVTIGAVQVIISSREFMMTFFKSNIQLIELLDLLRIAIRLKWNIIVSECGFDSNTVEDISVKLHIKVGLNGNILAIPNAETASIRSTIADAVEIYETGLCCIGIRKGIDG